MGHPSRTPIEELRLAVERLPQQTKLAMLEGIAQAPIIAGAYTDGRGICPMLAAHRAGGRTSFASFAQAWDRFVFGDARRRRRARRATRRELAVLRSHLEASLLEDCGPTAQLAQVRAEHEALRQAREARDARELPKPRKRARPGDPDRSRELRHRSGWAWTRVVRRYEDYERALALLDEHSQQLAAERLGDRPLSRH
jgi:hypothetical protein